ncbi:MULTISPECIES: O-acetylhomoserine aminocarboxypropyltransferase/cysteine synthase family protein [unclassified Leucobacter]|uniref:O-acetylhomoserine aminocarboxypropyltransferase/cysteine synthase family protein n=1 Tax=unclassified Leucobacter TaxID=2621730 RepID=UPI00165D77F5|nr:MULTISPECIES: aminotransferase class I/II-fold pyridoxal phosphate-dependent enzyme [unclassified Leucobacter]MBC9927866.1 O-acetylhomoserine aminocarboxypropyltransferase/cysteine synthase [Leucobacter sp. cx-169]
MSTVTEATRPASALSPEHDWDGYAFETRQVHAGAEPDPAHGLRVPPIALSAGYVFDDFDDGAARFSGDSRGPIYSRQGNPTNAVAERRLASLEGGVAAVAVSSGQAAISAALFALAGAGEHIVSTASIYGGTRILFGRSFRRFGIDVSYVWDSADDAEWERAITPQTRAIYTETVPNPLGDITDLSRIAEVARRHGLPLVVDNTVGTPALIRPIEHGANIVVHSSTKFLTGNGAAVSGIIVDGGSFDWDATGDRYPLVTRAPRPGVRSLRDRFGDAAYAQAAREAVVNDIGPSLSPFNGFLLHQGLETLSLRMERHVDSTLTIAAWLAEQPEVEAVHYAGLPEHPLHALAQRDYAGRTGSVFGVTVRGGVDGAREVFNGVRVFSRMTGIGDTRSMILHPRTSTHASFDNETNERLGIEQGLLRLSVGLESPDDLIRDLRGALDRLA